MLYIAVALRLTASGCTNLKTYDLTDTDSSRWPLYGFPTKPLYAVLFSPLRATCPHRLILLDFITIIIFGEEFKL
jgi:hypothetical protein